NPAREYFSCGKMHETICAPGIHTALRILPYIFPDSDWLCFVPPHLHPAVLHNTEQFDKSDLDLPAVFYPSFLKTLHLRNSGNTPPPSPAEYLLPKMQYEFLL